jgi:DNA recombination protein RmuC
VVFLYVVVVASILAALLGLLRFSEKRWEGLSSNVASKDDIAQIIRRELESLKKDASDQALALRHEISENLTRFQSSTLQILDRKFAEQISVSSEASRLAREEVANNFQRLSVNVRDSVTDLASRQKEQLEAVTAAVRSLTDSHERSQNALRATVEGRLDIIRSENAAKLDEMRHAVDEKLESTLERRLGESFRIVTENRTQVQKGLGEMQSLAAGVGDLKKVLSNVKVRGTWGEVQLCNLLEDFLAPEQFVRNAVVKDDTRESVEFAIRLPGLGEGKEVLLPIDAKFPQEDFERLILASEQGEKDGVLAASSALEGRLRTCAKTISDKYIAPPRTTDFAVLFLPTESLYAEVLRRPGLFESLQREYRVTLAGPTTLTAILKALSMGFRSVAIEKRSGEVWKLLGAIQAEFRNYGGVVYRLRKQLNTAMKTITSLDTRARVMNQKLLDVDRLPDNAASELLGLDVINNEEPGETAQPEEAAAPVAASGSF